MNPHAKSVLSRLEMGMFNSFRSFVSFVRSFNPHLILDQCCVYCATAINEQSNRKDSRSGGNYRVKAMKQNAYWERMRQDCYTVRPSDAYSHIKRVFRTVESWAVQSKSYEHDLAVAGTHSLTPSTTRFSGVIFNGRVLPLALKKWLLVYCSGANDWQKTHILTQNGERNCHQRCASHCTGALEYPTAYTLFSIGRLSRDLMWRDKLMNWQRSHWITAIGIWKSYRSVRQERSSSLMSVLTELQQHSYHSQRQADGFKLKVHCSFDVKMDLCVCVCCVMSNDDNQTQIFHELQGSSFAEIPMNVTTIHWGYHITIHHITAKNTALFVRCVRGVSMYERRINVLFFLQVLGQCIGRWRSVDWIMIWRCATI